MLVQADLPATPQQLYTAGFRFPGQTPVSPMPSVLTALAHLGWTRPATCSPITLNTEQGAQVSPSKKEVWRAKDPGVCPIGNWELSAQIKGFQAPRTSLNVRDGGKKLTHAVFLPTGHRWAEWVRREGDGCLLGICSVTSPLSRLSVLG